jgi:hypothetical protein
VTLIIPGEAFGGETRLFRENVLEEFSDALNLAAASLSLWAVGTRQAFLVFDGHVPQEVLKYLNIFWWLAHLHKRPDKYRVIVQLHHVIGAIHIDLHLRILELLKFIFVQVIGEWGLGAPKMATQDQKLVFASLV